MKPPARMIPKIISRSPPRRSSSDFGRMTIPEPAYTPIPTPIPTISKYIPLRYERKQLSPRRYESKNIFGSLPNETMLQICEYMNLEDLINFTQRSPDNYKVCSKILNEQIKKHILSIIPAGHNKFLDMTEFDIYFPIVLEESPAGKGILRKYGTKIIDTNFENINFNDYYKIPGYDKMLIRKDKVDEYYNLEDIMNS